MRSGATHVEFQAAVVDAMHLFGWQHLHVRRSIGKGSKWVTSTNIKGWPDLFAWHVVGGFLAAELKVPPDTATADQDAVLASLALAGARAFVWTPHDWPAINAALDTRLTHPKGNPHHE
jgi:hypothetical protein